MAVTLVCFFGSVVILYFVIIIGLVLVQRRCRSYLQNKLLLIASSSSGNMQENTDPKNSGQSDPERERAIEGWTKAEKYGLFQGLKSFGSNDISNLLPLIPNKSSEQIRNAIKYYKGKALSRAQYPQLKKSNKKKKSNSESQSIPLSRWAKVLTDSYNFDELKTVMATALRLIAELEDIPHPVCTEYIDFRKAYHMLANAMEGKALQNDKLLICLINKCLLETALIGRTFIRKSKLRSIIENIDMSDKEIKVYNKPHAESELSILLQLASLNSYNPLKIPEEYLKPSKYFE